MRLRACMISTGAIKGATVKLPPWLVLPPMDECPHAELFPGMLKFLVPVVI